MEGINRRNYGVDVLRIVSMLMIMIMHVLEHGGIINNLESLSFKYALFWLLEIMTYCGVNCYALVSGYVNCFSKGFYFSRIITLWLQVLFYGVTITAIIAIIKPSTFGLSQIINVVFPVTTGQYWYFTAYFCLFFFMPALNTVINVIPKKYFQITILAIIGLFSILPTFSNKDPFIIKYGFSTGWLASCYLIGGYIRKHGVKYQILDNKGLLVFFLCMAITFFTKIGIEYFTSLINHPHSGNIFVNYTSPTILLGAVALLIYFSKKGISKKNQSFIGFFASTSFGVYLIHEQPLFRELMIKDTFTILLKINPMIAVIIIIIVALIAYLLLSCIDWFRAKLFMWIKLQSFVKRFDIVDQ